MQSWHNRYPIDVFPTFWQHIDELISSGELVATEVVLFELEAKDDTLKEWAKNQNGLFVELDDVVQIRAREILTTFPALVKKKADRTEADTFVIALALENNYVVVTEEQFGNTRNPKIPIVCDNYRIRCINILELIRECRWSY
jgi:hypothetical protein